MQSHSGTHQPPLRWSSSGTAKLPAACLLVPRVRGAWEHGFVERKRKQKGAREPAGPAGETEGSREDEVYEAGLQARRLPVRRRRRPVSTPTRLLSLLPRPNLLSIFLLRQSGSSLLPCLPVCMFYGVYPTLLPRIAASSPSCKKICAFLCRALESC